jgi:SP family general alpha glucoside:H+ symporter-like MFS transporter
MEGRQNSTRNASIDEKDSNSNIKDIDSTKDAVSVDTDTALGFQQEKEMTISKAFWYYRKAVCWSILICKSNASWQHFRYSTNDSVALANIMESYDIQLIKAFYAFPQFNKKYGFRLPNGTYQVNANWQLGLSLAQFCGLIVGVFANAPLAERFGPRRVMMVAFVLLIGFITITFDAHSISMLFGGELLWYVS